MKKFGWLAISPIIFIALSPLSVPFIIDHPENIPYKEIQHNIVRAMPDLWAYFLERGLYDKDNGRIIKNRIYYEYGQVEMLKDGNAVLCDVCLKATDRCICGKWRHIK